MVNEEALILQGERQGLETVTMLEFVPQGRGAAVVGAAIRGVVGRWTTRATARSLIHCGCCFVGDTPVLTAEGLMPIEKVTVGTLVQSRDEHTGEVALKPVTDLIRHDNRALYGLTLIRENGRAVRIESSDNHPFWVEGQGWVDSAKLRRGMKVPSFNGELLTVVNVQALGRSGKTFNLTMADFHTFFAGEASAYVHNQCPCALAAKGTAAAAHSVAFETTIAKAGVGTRGSHFTDANKSLASAMNKDPAFAKMMDDLGVKIPQRLDQSPANWSWRKLPHQVDS